MYLITLLITGGNGFDDNRSDRLLLPSRPESAPPGRRLNNPGEHCASFEDFKQKWGLAEPTRPKLSIEEYKKRREDSLMEVDQLNPEPTAHDHAYAAGHQDSTYRQQGAQGSEPTGAARSAKRYRPEIEDISDEEIEGPDSSPSVIQTGPQQRPTVIHRSKMPQPRPVHQFKEPAPYLQVQKGYPQVPPQYIREGWYPQPGPNSNGGRGQPRMVPTTPQVETNYHISFNKAINLCRI